MTDRECIPELLESKVSSESPELNNVLQLCISSPDTIDATAKSLFPVVPLGGCQRESLICSETPSGVGGCAQEL